MANQSGFGERSAEASQNASVYGACAEGQLDDGGALATFAVSVGVLLLCENILLITVIVRTRSLHTNTNILVASLAITDVLVGAQVCLMGLSEQPTGMRSWLNLTPREIRIFDSFFTGLNFSLVTVSICHLSALALDRYLYVLWPLHYHIRVTRRRVLATSGLLWILGLVYFAIAIIVFRNPKHHINCLIWETPAVYGTWPLASVYFLCMCIVLASTIGIAKIAVKHRRKKQAKLVSRSSRLLCHSVRRNAVEDGGSMVKPHEISLNVPENATDSRNAQPTIFTSNNSGMFSSSVAGSSKMVGNDTHFYKDFNENAQATCQQETKDSSDPNLCTYHIRHEKCLMSSLKNTEQQQMLAVSVSETSHQNHRDAEKSLADTHIVIDTFNGVQSADIKGMSERESFDTAKIPPEAKEKQAVPIRVKNIRPLIERDGQGKNSKLLNHENVKIIKFVFVMCGCFLLCTFLPLVSFIVRSANPSLSLPDGMTPVLFIMLGANSGLNFLIITFMNKDFRFALVQIISCGKVSCHPKTL
ncbi:melanocortin receptor 3-like [Elysia marginata]|uniref:Melanocortin receptor 3-like n=1 Tax=Elysia marginata TaxID=1093978 RepID=A0AAV4JA81_9GAST|nr:melanocortin receptor 3-like [Elysia marginata]